MEQVGSAVHPSFELLSAYHDAEASKAEAARVSTHLDRCNACRRQVGGFDLLSMALAGSPALGCASASPLLSAQLDGETSREEAAIATAHLAGCAPCRTARAGWQQLDLALATLPSGIPSAAADARIRGLAHRRRLIPAGPSLGGGLLGRGLVAALAMLIAVVATIPRGATPGQAEQHVGISEDAALVAAVQQVLNPRTNTLYVLEPARGVVVAKNATTNEPIAQISVGGRPTALALNEATNVVYVLDPSTKTYTEISGTTNTVTARVSVPVSGNPTTIDVNAKTGEVVIAARPATTTNAQPSASPGGQLAVINPDTKKIDVREVDVAPTQVVLDGAGGRLFLLGAKSTSVIDAKTYQTIATLPAAISVAASAIGGAPALLTGADGKAQLSFYGATTRASFEGSPVSVIGLPNGTFAVLLDRAGIGQIAIIGADGATVGSLDVLGTTRALTYDPDTQRFLGANGQAVASIGNGAVAAITPAPQPTDRPAAPSAAPSAPPSAATSPSAPVVSAPPTKPAAAAPAQPTVPAGTVPGSLVATGSFSRLDVGLAAGTDLIAEGSRIWALAPDGGLSAIDSTTGIASRVASFGAIGRGVTLAVASARFYAMDPSTATLWSVDARNGQVRSWSVPFGSSVTGIAVAGDGRVWLAPNSYAGLIQFDPRTGAFALVGLPAGASPTAVAVDLAGTIWYADAGRALVGSYEPSLRRFTELRSPARGPIHSIGVEASGQVWFVASSGDTFTTAGASAGLARSVGTTVAASASGQAASWFVSSDGASLVGRLTGGGTFVGPAQAAGIAVDPAGRVWLSSGATGALFILDPR